MKARAVVSFKDKKEGVIRKAGDTFILNKERFEEINSTVNGKLVEEIKEKSKK